MARKPLLKKDSGDSDAASGGARDSDLDLDLDRDKAMSLSLGGRGGGGGNRRLTFAGYRKVMKLVQDGRRSSRRKVPSNQMRAGRSRHVAPQRVSVRLTYGRNKGDGQWYAHGRYLEREAATDIGGDGRGFGHAGDEMPIAKTLESWQAADDPNLFKLIISPEHGDRLDLREYTRAYIGEIEARLGTRLEWVAAAHFNTDHPHVHVALRGRDDTGKPLIIPREFIKGPLREIAQEAATRRLGHRTEQDVHEARQKQIGQHRFTDLDRALLRKSEVAQDGSLLVDFSSPLRATHSEGAKELRLQQIKRLGTLEQMGLARRGEGGRWYLDAGTETILRERQIANDRLKTIYNHRALVSDPRLPLASAPKGDARIAGRFIGSGLDDASGRSYLLVENVQGSVMYMYQSKSTETARREGLKPGDFVVLTQRSYKDRQGREGESLFLRAFGPAENVLKNPALLDGELRRHIASTGREPTGSTYGGWMGQYHQALVDRAAHHRQRGTLKGQGDGITFAAPRETRSRPGRGGRDTTSR